MARDTWLAIVNPVAGKGAGASLAGTLAATFAEVGLRVDITLSPGPGECARLAAAAVDDGYKVILSVGGDGTANEIANGMVGSSATLALYPIGTGNDFARNLGYPRKRRGVAAFLAKATPREIDTGLANGRAFVDPRLVTPGRVNVAALSNRLQHFSVGSAADGIGGHQARRAQAHGWYLQPERI